ncbi:hypothetical protein J2R77_002452 [Bradyrhizobium sp. USDA 4537]|nr:hypothetical protein [Bradyrhizobium sp. USDA 4537]
MGVSRRRCCLRREQIPTRFALASKATSPFQGEVSMRSPDAANGSRECAPDDRLREIRGTSNPQIQRPRITHGKVDRLG